MGWSTSIHVKTGELDKVANALQDLHEYNCLVGHSGLNWVGVFSQISEETVGEATPRVAEELSQVLNDYVLGLFLCEDGFKYWLFRGGKVRDQLPSNSIRLFSRNREREILKLAVNDQSKKQIERAIEPKVHKRPHEVLGITEAEFLEESNRDLMRLPTMSPAERKQMEDKYARIRPPHEEDYRRLCEAVGIMEGDWNYSELIECEKSTDCKEVWASMGLRRM